MHVSYTDGNILNYFANFLSYIQFSMQKTVLYYDYSEILYNANVFCFCRMVSFDIRYTSTHWWYKCDLFIWQGAWKPVLNITTLLTTIQLLMADPNPDDPLMADIVSTGVNSACGSSVCFLCWRGCIASNKLHHHTLTNVILVSLT